MLTYFSAGHISLKMFLDMQWSSCIWIMEISCWIFSFSFVMNENSHTLLSVSILLHEMPICFLFFSQLIKKVCQNEICFIKKALLLGLLIACHTLTFRLCTGIHCSKKDCILVWVSEGFVVSFWEEAGSLPSSDIKSLDSTLESLWI